MSADNQGDIFATSEGDRWFERNRDSLDRFDPDEDVPMRLIAEASPPPRSVAELGAANGYRVAALMARYGCRGVAVEPSAAAVSDGQRRYPQVRFLLGRIDSVPSDELFDLVIVNFVLHWVDRSRLIQAAAEIDRLLVDEGHLLLGDFLPGRPSRAVYHHLPDADVWTYKQDYSAMFIASGLYEPVASLVQGPPDEAVAKDSEIDDRLGHWLLRKRAGGIHVPGSEASRSTGSGD